LPDDMGTLAADREPHEDASDRDPRLALGPLHPVSDEPGERSDRAGESSVRATKAPTMNALVPRSQESHMGGHRLRWYQVGHWPLRDKDADSCRDRHQPVIDHRAPSPTPTAYKKLAADCDGAVVARSQILVSGSTATLLGTLTNETSGHVYFSGMPPYAITFETDGSKTVLLGDFNSSPREQPSCGDCVMQPGASIPYRSLPITVKNPHPRWDGTDWCAYSQSTMLDLTFRHYQEVPMVQLFDADCPAPGEGGNPTG
jgi:hypothetical protein